jgi:hypothetical protein
MNEPQHSNYPHGNPNSDSARGGHRPYWKRAHHDWRLWVGVVLMPTAMMIYIMSEDFAWLPRIQPRQSFSGTVGK